MNWLNNYLKVLNPSVKKRILYRQYHKKKPEKSKFLRLLFILEWEPESNSPDKKTKKTTFNRVSSLNSAVLNFA